MNSKVLLVGSPSDALRRSLSGEFWIQNCPNPTDALQLLPKTDCVVLICCIDNEQQALDFMTRATESRSRLPGILMVPDHWTAHLEVPAGSPLLMLPAQTNAELVRLNVRECIRHDRKEADQKELFGKSVSGTVSAFFEVLSIIDPYSASLGQRLRLAMDLFCKAAQVELGWELETGALLAEIGVLTIPFRVLMRHQAGQELSPFEKDMISHVPERGADLLQQMPSFNSVAEMIRYQGKNFDGSGLPADSLAGDKLPLGARILKLLNDLFRLVENGRDKDEVIAEMEGREGRYDPHLFRIAKECFDPNLPSKISGSTLPLKVSDLRPGQLLVSKIETDDGVLLIRDGQVISPRLLHKLRNFAFTSGVKEPIYVIDLLESPKMTTTFRDIASAGGTSFLARPK